MCPFKKAFPLVLFLHLLFAVGIFASFAEHRSAEHLFTLLPALGVGEELRAGEISGHEEAPADAPVAVVPPAPAPKIAPVVEAKKMVPAAVVTSNAAVVQPQAAMPTKTFAPRGSVAGDTPSDYARVGGAMGSDENFGGRVTPPIALKKQKPAHAGEKGEVVLNFTINEKGCVENVSVERSPSAAMTEAVMNVLPKWRFVPAKEEGKVISMRVRQVVKF